MYYCYYLIWLLGAVAGLCRSGATLVRSRADTAFYLGDRGGREIMKVGGVRKTKRSNNLPCLNFDPSHTHTKGNNL